MKQSPPVYSLQTSKAPRDQNKVEAIVTPEQEQQINESIMNAIPIAANIVKKTMMQSTASGEEPNVWALFKRAIGIVKNDGIALPEPESKTQLPEHGTDNA